MKTKIQIIIAAVGIVVLAAAFRYASGPFYFGNNNDPSYYYLYNFLYLLEGKSLPFTDHPGMPLNFLGSLVIKLFFHSQQGTPWLYTYAAQSEQVLFIVWLSMITIYGASIVFLGFYLMNKSNDRVLTGSVLVSSLWLLIIPSYNGAGVMPISANVNSDTMMLFAVNLMLLAVVRFYYSGQSRSWGHAICLGTAAGFAIATKFTAVPYLAVALVILETWQQRILLVGAAGTVFFLLTYPIWGAYPQMMAWVKGLILERGMHGSGGSGFDRSAYWNNFLFIVQHYWFFIGIWIASGIAALQASWRIDAKIRKILFGLGLGGLVQVLIVAKQMSFHYLTPMIGLSSLFLTFIIKAYPDWWTKVLKYALGIILIISLGIIPWSMGQIAKSTHHTQDMLDQIAHQYSQCQVCPFYRSSTPGFGLVFWNRLVHRQDYALCLKKNYPDLVYYDIFGLDFKDSAEQIIPLAQLKQQKSCVLIYGSDQNPQNFEPGLTVKKIYTNGGPEALYEVVSIRSRLGLTYLDNAKALYAQGKYEDALKALAISQQLGVSK